MENGSTVCIGNAGRMIDLVRFGNQLITSDTELGATQFYATVTGLADNLIHLEHTMVIKTRTIQ